MTPRKLITPAPSTAERKAIASSHGTLLPSHKTLLPLLPNVTHAATFDIPSTYLDNKVDDHKSTLDQRIRTAPKVTFLTHESSYPNNLQRHHYTKTELVITRYIF